MGRRGFKIGWLALWLLAAVSIVPGKTALAQSSDQVASNAGAGGYQVGEDPQPQPVTETDSIGVTTTDTSGPVRLARFSYTHGNVTWRDSDTSAWSEAAVNLPIRQGAQIWVTEGGRAEVQFDDGSLLRLGNGALVTLQTLYSDADGEFTEIKLQAGLVALRLKHATSKYQVDTPLVSATASGPAAVRFGVNDGVEIAVKSGHVALESDQNRADIEADSYLNLRDSASTYDVVPLPDRDSWDRWNDERDRQLDDAVSASNLPANIALVAGDLNSYGTWRNDPQYGSVWCPRTTVTSWRPYHDGHWVWVTPFGWTWVSSEPWGWAPYHYGTWVSASYGWAWVPGPACQYWSPAVVNFCENNGAVAWTPLAPVEVRYPSRFSIGYRHGDWSLSFSIGRAGVFYPVNDRFCEARPWRNRDINHITIVNNVTNIYGDSGFNRNRYETHRAFVPYNARRAAGSTMARLDAFGGRGNYEFMERGRTEFFTRGHGIGAPRGGESPIGGPLTVRPTVEGMTPSRTFLNGRESLRPILRREVVRSQLPPAVSRWSESTGHSDRGDQGHRNPGWRTNPVQGNATPITRPGETHRPGWRTNPVQDNATPITRPGETHRPGWRSGTDQQPVADTVRSDGTRPTTDSGQSTLPGTMHRGRMPVYGTSNVPGTEHRGRSPVYRTPSQAPENAASPTTWRGNPRRDRATDSGTSSPGVSGTSPARDGASRDRGQDRPRPDFSGAHPAYGLRHTDTSRGDTPRSGSRTSGSKKSDDKSKKADKNTDKDTDKDKDKHSQ